MSGRKRNTFNRSVKVRLDETVPPVLPEPEEEFDWRVGGVNCWVVIVPRVFAAPVLKIFKPSCWSFVRSTSANLTSSKICCSCTGATINEFTTPGEYA